MKFILLILFSVSTYINAFEYNSTHDETYWFPDTENQLNGYHIGAVRSNTVWGDAMRFYVDENYCNEPPLLTFVVSTTNTVDLAANDKNFNINDYLDHKVSFDLVFDTGHEETIEASIFEVSANNSALDLFIFMIPSIPRIFASTDPDLKTFNQFMSLTVSESDPLYHLFDEPNRKYRMGGFVPVWMDAHQKCLDSTSEVFHD